MTETTFEQPDPGDARGFEPEQWAAVGFEREAAKAWWRNRIDRDEALRWCKAGVTEPIDAVRWKIAGVDPRTVREWTYAEIDARAAVAWTELGFNAASARKHKRAGRTPAAAFGHRHRVQTGAPVPMPSGPVLGRPGSSRLMHVPGDLQMHRFIQSVRERHPQVLHTYMQRQWLDDEALAWALHGIDAGDAAAWRELGLTPVEAERQQAQGLGAMQTAKAWWQAGIPFDEVADWIGAGLTPQEAAEQRASGVTAERAAVLRSLRKRKGPG